MVAMSRSLPILKTDLLLLHPPAYFDFRERRDIYFPFLSTSGDVPITPLYEYFPIGFKSLEQYLSNYGIDVKIINLCSVLLRYPKIDLNSLFDSIQAKLIGIDLHWMVHVQGCLSIAQLIKQKFPAVPIIIGGISSSYYAEEIIQYPMIDLVMKGYDTHLPMLSLMRALSSGGDLHSVPNLLWKSENGYIHKNESLHLPREFGIGINWSNIPTGQLGNSLPIRDLLSIQNTGCSFNCCWCGGSRDTFHRLYQSSNSVVRKSLREIKYEINSLNRLPNTKQYMFYSANTYNESKSRLKSIIDQIGKSNLRSVNYEQFHLPSVEIMNWMVKANDKTIITLSPESHDYRISKLAGRGAYTNEELERWLEKAFATGIYHVDIWYFVGMPEQDETSVYETVAYCANLLEKFKGQRINPMICPMIPFLDPGSNIFENPTRYGYQLFHRTVEEHRRAMERASIINRINYETRWLNRRDLIYVGYEAVSRLMEIKSSCGQLPFTITNNFTRKIKDALEFIDVVHSVDNIKDEMVRNRELENIGDDILRRNNMIFFDGVMNQAFPVNRQIGGRWFDEMGWNVEEFETVNYL